MMRPNHHKLLSVSLILVAAALPSAADAATPRDWCFGTFIRKSCVIYESLSNELCRPIGYKEEFIGYEIRNGIRAYVVYRLGSYSAKDIKLQNGCALKKY